MSNKQLDENLFKKLEKIFGFNKKNEQIFVPKELAKQLIPEVEEKTTPKLVQKSVETPAMVKKVEKPVIAPVKQPKNIFDLTDISDIDPKVSIKVKPLCEPLNDFSSRIFNLFDIAKKNGIMALDFDQLTAAYYRVYTTNNKSDLKTRPQIYSKVHNMEYSKKKNIRNAYLVKVENNDSAYRLSDY